MAMYLLGFSKKNYFEKIKIMKRGKLTSPLGVYGGGSTLS